MFYENPIYKVIEGLSRKLSTFPSKLFDKLSRLKVSELVTIR